MILKVKTSAECVKAWRFFECDEVQSSDDIEDQSVDGVAYHSFNSGKSRGFINISFIGKGGQPTEVLTDMDVYLLNESGQTIDRLN